MKELKPNIEQIRQNIYNLGRECGNAYFHHMTAEPRLTTQCLRALGNARNVAAGTIGLATSHGNAGPGPASAGSAATTGNNNIISVTRDGLGAADV
jgi:hypothetical protein